MDKQFFLILCILCSVSCLDKYLRFTSNKTLEQMSNIQYVYELKQKPVIIDAVLSRQVLVKYNQEQPDIAFPHLIFHCQVKKLDPLYQISNAFLCKRNSLESTEDCHKVNSDVKSVMFDFIMIFEINFDSLKGFTSVLKMKIDNIKSRNKAFDGFYYCKLGNTAGTLTSNYIEIQDYEFYKKTVSRSISPITIEHKPINLGSITKFPVYLDCGRATIDPNKNLPKWAKDNLESPFIWKFCLGRSDGVGCYSALTDQKTTSVQNIQASLNFHQYLNGTVVLLGLKPQPYIPSGLICYYFTQFVNTYAIYLTKKGSGEFGVDDWKPISIEKNMQYNEPIQILSELEKEITVREGIYGVSKFKLSALYIVNPDHSKRRIKWARKGQYLTDMTEQDYDLTFPNIINKTHSGKYSLTVTQFEPPSEVIFNFNVIVVGVPTLKIDSEPLGIIYRMADESVNLTMEFDGNILKRGIEINGEPIDITSEESKNTSLFGLYDKFHFLKGIRVSLYFGDGSDSGIMTYTASNLVRNADAPRAKTHTVTFFAENELGVSKKSVLIRVFESPQYIHYLDTFNCTTNCKNTDPHEFKCAINEIEFVNEGLTVDYLWNLNDGNLNNMDGKYIQRQYTKLNKGTLTLIPVATDNSKKDDEMAKILKNANLICKVHIYEPKQSTTIPKTPRRLYSSDSYPELLTKLKANIMLDMALNKASASWIIPLILSLLVLVIIVILILYFCLRGSGETYNVDQKERAQGYDPEKEIRDNEIFQPYERDHDNTAMQPSRLSFNDDDSVGVGSDDGELDAYDIDPGKFNEEGSFIGQYASDPRKSKPSNGK